MTGFVSVSASAMVFASSFLSFELATYCILSLYFWHNVVILFALYEIRLMEDLKLVFVYCTGM